jgi:beta-lactamase class A
MDWAEGEWSALAVDADTDRVLLEHDPELLLPTASVGKLFLLHHLAELLDADPAAGEEVVRKDAVEPVADSGLWQHLRVEALPVVDAARLVGTVSDNLATNVLLGHVGLEPVQAVARRLAPTGSMLHDRVRDVRRPRDPATLSTGCARDWADYFRAPHPRVLDWLSASTDLSMVAGALELDPLAHVGSEPRVWSKTGTDTGTRADVGLVEHGGRRAAYAVICRYDDPAATPAVLSRMRTVGELLLDALRT